MSRTLLAALALAGCAADAESELDAAATGSRIEIDATQERHRVGADLLGANINQWFDHAQGLWDAARDRPAPDPAAKAARARLGLLRYPGGTAANLFHWKRAVGRVANRRCQTDAAADFIARRDVDYGPVQFGRLLDAVGAHGQIMVPFAPQTPEDAADLVEYMNAPLGTNPNGGVAWAEVRAADGSPEPIGITRWELGNEHDRAGEGYWMQERGDLTRDQMLQRRLAQYIAGDEFRVADQAMGRDCDFTAPTGSGEPNQVFDLLWGLVKPGTFPTVTVAGTAWTRATAAELAAAGATARLYVFDRGDGSVRFGDGVHGAVVPRGARVAATYTLQHRGFVAIYDAMKQTAAAIGTPIDVCSTWAPVDTRGAPLAEVGEPSFATAMQRRGKAGSYDCVVIHPYTAFERDFGRVWQSSADAHDDTMLGDDWARTMVRQLADDLAAHGTGQYVAISELGALWFGDSDEAAASRAAVPQASYMMSHALYMASQWTHFARIGLGWVEGNTLVADARSLRSTLGGRATGFVYSAEAMAREALGDVFAPGGRWIASDVSDPDYVVRGDDRYATLAVGATRGADDHLRIVIVNRQRRPAAPAVAITGYPHARAIAVTTVRGDRFDSAIDGPDEPADDAVRIEHSTLTSARDVLRPALPPASITVLDLAPL